MLKVSKKPVALDALMYVALQDGAKDSVSVFREWLEVCSPKNIQYLCKGTREDCIAEAVRLLTLDSTLDCRCLLSGHQFQYPVEQLVGVTLLELPWICLDMDNRMYERAKTQILMQDYFKIVNVKFLSDVRPYICKMMHCKFGETYETLSEIDKNRIYEMIPKDIVQCNGESKELVAREFFYSEF